LSETIVPVFAIFVLGVFALLVLNQKYITASTIDIFTASDFVSKHVVR